MTDLQRINVKIITPTPPATNLEPLIAIFTRWLQTDTEWLDIADYLHMLDGPGVLLFGLERFVSFDCIQGIPGVLYASRRGLAGDLSQRIQTVMAAALAIAKRLLSEPACPAEVARETTQLILTINNRKLAPNQDSSLPTFEPALRQALASLLGKGYGTLARITDPHSLFGYQIHLNSPYSLT